MQQISRYLALTLAAAGAAMPIGAGGQPDPGADALREARAEFVAAFAEEGRGRTVAVESAQLRSYVLYPYLEAARLERALAGTGTAITETDARVAEFLERHGGEPVGLDLRRDWLESLAGRGLWETFLVHYDPAAATQALQCRRLEARIETGAVDGIAPDIIAIWLTPRQLPLVCERAFQWLRDQGQLDAELTERRVRLLLDNGEADFAGVIARRLPAERSAGLLERASFLQSPLGAIDRYLADPDADADPRAIVAGFARLARNSPEAAADRLDGLLAALAHDADAEADLLATLALGLAWDRSALALDVFARVPAERVDDYLLTWLARSALWAADWALVDLSIGSMSDLERTQTAWRYWAARAAEALGDASRAERLFASVLPDDNYYSAMAAARLDRRMEPRREPVAWDDRARAELARLPGLVRARELARAGLRSRATAEWIHADRQLSAAERQQSIRLAADWELYDVAVATATRLAIFNDYDLLYPRPFEAQVDRAVRLTDIDRHLLLGLLRQESLFRFDAVSSAGAVGVAQLNRDTAVATARGWGLPTPTREDLLVPETGITLGAARLRDLLERYEDQLPVALAAYNAGPRPANRWLPETPLDSDIWIENIPYNETRAYVRRVLWHSLVYDWLDSQRAQSATAWLEPVRPVGD